LDATTTIECPVMMRTIPALYSIVAVLSLLASGGGCNSHSPIAARPATTQAATEKDQEIATLRHIEYYLASDELEGRGIDTPGINTAAEFIRTWFQAEHLKSPPGISAYFQPFDYSSAAGIDPATTLKSGSTTYKLEDDFMAMSFSAEAKFAGDVVFAGYGITWPEKKYDDYADLDVKGKVVLVMRFEPHDSKASARAIDQQRIDRRLRHRVTSRRLADVDAFRTGARLRNEFGRDKPIEDDDVRAAKRFEASHRYEPGVAWACADKRDHYGISSPWGDCCASSTAYFAAMSATMRSARFSSPASMASGAAESKTSPAKRARAA